MATYMIQRLKLTGRKKLASSQLMINAEDMENSNTVEQVYKTYP